MSFTFEVLTSWENLTLYRYAIDSLPENWNKMSNFDKFVYLESNVDDVKILNDSPERLLDVNSVEEVK